MNDNYVVYTVVKYKDAICPRCWTGSHWGVVREAKLYGTEKEAHESADKVGGYVVSCVLNMGSAA
jgi:hypothetical protein